MSTLDYAGYRTRLKAGKGVLFLLQTKQVLYLTPLKAFSPLLEHTKHSILISLARTKDNISDGVFVWNAQFPPTSAIKLAKEGFPLHHAAFVHGLLCRIFFPLKLPPSQLLLDYPRTKKGTFCKSKETKTTTPPLTKKKRTYEPTTPTQKQLAKARAKTRTSTKTSGTETGPIIDI